MVRIWRWIIGWLARRWRARTLERSDAVRRLRRVRGEDEPTDRGRARRPGEPEERDGTGPAQGGRGDGGPGGS